MVVWELLLKEITTGMTAPSQQEYYVNQRKPSSDKL